MTDNPNYERGFGGVILSQAQLTALTVVRDAQLSVFVSNETGEGIGVPLYTTLLEFISTNTASSDVDDFEIQTDIAEDHKDEIKERLKTAAGQAGSASGAGRLKPEEWRSGKTHVIVDFVSPFVTDEDEKKRMLASVFEEGKKGAR